MNSTPNTPAESRNRTVPTTYTVLPAGAQLTDDEVGYFSAQVVHRNTGRWAVTWAGKTLSRDGEWDFEQHPTDTDDDRWTTAHLFDLNDALGRAEAAVDELSFNDVTWVDVVQARALGDREAAQAYLQECRDRRRAQSATSSAPAGYQETSTRLEALTHTDHRRTGAWTSTMTAELAERVLEHLAAVGVRAPALTRGEDTIRFGWLLEGAGEQMLRVTVDVTAEIVSAGWRSIPSGEGERLGEVSPTGAAAFVARIIEARTDPTSRT